MEPASVDDLLEELERELGPEKADEVRAVALGVIEALRRRHRYRATPKVAAQPEHEAELAELVDKIAAWIVQNGFLNKKGGPYLLLWFAARTKRLYGISIYNLVVKHLPKEDSDGKDLHRKLDEIIEYGIQHDKKDEGDAQNLRRGGRDLAVRFVANLTPDEKKRYRRWLTKLLGAVGLTLIGERVVEASTAKAAAQGAGLKWLIGLGGLLAIAGGALVLMRCRDDQEVADDRSVDASSPYSTTKQPPTADRLSTRNNDDAGPTLEECDAMEGTEKRRCLIDAADHVLARDAAQAMSVYDAALKVEAPPEANVAHALLELDALDGRAASLSRMGRDADALAQLRARRKRWAEIEPTLTFGVNMQPQCLAEVMLTYRLTGADAAYDEGTRCAEAPMPGNKGGPHAFALALVEEKSGHLGAAIRHYLAMTAFEPGRTDKDPWAFIEYRWKHLVPSDLAVKGNEGVVRILDQLQAQGKAAVVGSFAVWRRGNDFTVMVRVPEGCTFGRTEWRAQLEVAGWKALKEPGKLDPAILKEFGVDVEVPRRFPRRTVRLHTNSNSAACDGRVSLTLKQAFCFEAGEVLRLGPC